MNVLIKVDPDKNPALKGKKSFPHMLVAKVKDSQLHYSFLLDITIIH